MEGKPKQPFLKKGTGKYPKINYPVLRKSGAFQPPVTSSPTKRNEPYVTRKMSPLKATTNFNRLPYSPPRDRLYGTSRSPPRFDSPPRANYAQTGSRPSTGYISDYGSSELRYGSDNGVPTTVPRLDLDRETGVLGPSTPTDSAAGSQASSPRSGVPPTVTSAPTAPPSTFFGSSGTSRGLREAFDEGYERDASPGYRSARSRVAGTIDSGCPREDLILSPVSSTGDTRASSIPSVFFDDTVAAFPQGGQSRDQRSSPRDQRSSPKDQRSTPPADRISTPPATPATVLRPPVPQPRTIGADGSIIGNTTAEFEARERQIVYGQPRYERQIVHRDSNETESTVSSSASTTTRALQKEVAPVLKQVRAAVNDDSLPAPYRYRNIVATPIDTEGGGGRTNDVLGALNRLNRQEKMISARLEDTVSPSASMPSPIERDTVDGRGGVQTPDDEATSNFRIYQPSGESTLSSSQSVNGGHRPSSQESGSTAAARRFLLGERLPLDEAFGTNIDRTQQRPKQYTRASQATMRRVSPPVVREEERRHPSWPDSDDEVEQVIDLSHTLTREARVEDRTRRHGVDHDGRIRNGGAQQTVTAVQRRSVVDNGAEKSQRALQMESQLRDAIAHCDMAEAALRATARDLRVSFEEKSLELARGYMEKVAEVEKRMEEREDEMKKDRDEITDMRANLEKERRLLRKDEVSRVKEWRLKFEEEHASLVELRKKYAKEQSTRRLNETKLKKELDEAKTDLSSLRTENERTKKILENMQRGRASERGTSARRNAFDQAEAQSANGPKRNGLVKTMYGRGTGGSDKENEAISPFPQHHQSSQPQPNGILKNVRFADNLDTTFTVPPPDERKREICRGNGEWGPYIRYANQLGSECVASTPSCGCVICHYTNGDVRHFLVDRSITLYYFAAYESVQIDFMNERCEVRYYNGGLLEIFRSGREITRCFPNGERIETMKRSDGRMYAEIWQHHSVRIEGDSFLSPSPSPAVSSSYHPGKTATHRLGGSYVVLHSNHDLEFIEKSFLIVYFAATKQIKLVVRNTVAETQYLLWPSDCGQIVHVDVNSHGERKKSTCVEFGYEERQRRRR